MVIMDGYRGVPRFWRAVAALAVTALSLGLSACSSVSRRAAEKISEIRVSDFRIESFKPTSLRTADLDCSVKVYNPTVRLEMKDIVITVSYRDSEMATLAVEPIVLPKRSESEHRICTGLQLAPTASAFDLLALASGSVDYDDVSLHITATGVGAGLIRRPIDETMTLTELKSRISSTK